MAAKTKTRAAQAAPTVSVTLADFDSQEPFRLVRDAVALAGFTPLTLADYQPRGSTPLRDATARFIALLGERAAPGVVTVGLLLDRSGSMGGNEQSVVAGVNEFVGGLAGVERVDEAADGKVLAVILTDGCENASREVDAEQLRAMVSEREAQGWTFIFLGANQDAWAQGASLGYSGGVTGQTINYAGTAKGTGSGLRAASMRATHYLGDVGSLASFDSQASVDEDGNEFAENTAAPSPAPSPVPSPAPTTGSKYDVGAALRKARGE